MIRMTDPSNSMVSETGLGQQIYPYQLFETQELDEARGQVSHLFCPHRIEMADLGRQFYSSFTYAKLGNMSLCHIRYDGNVLIEPSARGAFYLIGMPMKGTTIVTCDQQHVVSMPGIATIQSPGQTVRVDWHDTSEKMVVKICQESMERHLTGLLGHPPNRPLEFQVEMPTAGGFGATLQHAIDAVSEEIKQQSCLASSPLAITQVEEMLMTLLLIGQPHNYTEELRQPVTPAAPYYVKRAEEFICASVKKQLNFSDVAEASGVSGRTLLEGFRRFRGISPMKFLRQKRLEHVRADLLQGALDDTVTEISMRWGFLHQGRFARDYHKRYGEVPSKTLNYRDDN